MDSTVHTVHMQFHVVGRTPCTFQSLLDRFIPLGLRATAATLPSQHTALHLCYRAGSTPGHRDACLLAQVHTAAHCRRATRRMEPLRALCEQFTAVDLVLLRAVLFKPPSRAKSETSHGLVPVTCTWPAVERR